ncbi:MAG: hypothetical protein NTV59_02445 [Chloroflexi bacterium]|nr:hypothetical protein [Chloroflexota bacterium]
MKCTKLAGVIILIVIAAVMASACGGSSSANTNQKPTSVPASDISKPSPTVLLVNATTAGLFENYYAILNITAKNEGADGVVIVVASITQAGQTQKNEMPVYLTAGSAQTVKLVFPLKWKGGDWTPTVQTEVP